MSTDPRDRVETVDERTGRLAAEARRDYELERVRQDTEARLSELAAEATAVEPDPRHAPDELASFVDHLERHIGHQAWRTRHVLGVGHAPADVDELGGALAHRLPPTDAALEQHRRAEAAAQFDADELGIAAHRRQLTDPTAHARTELAVRVAERGPYGRTIANLRDHGYERAAQDLRAGLRTAAAIALELVERDRDTAEAKLERARAAATRLLAGDHRDRAAANTVLEAIR